VKFRRKSDAPVDPTEDTDAETRAQDVDESAPTESVTDGTGPFDAADVDLEDGSRVDLGSLLIAPTQGREVRVQIDEVTKAVQAVLVAGPDGALELRAFAAPRNGDLWTDVRQQITADIEGKGGTVEERSGRFGPELVCERPVKLPDGTSVIQPSRVIGVNGPRWFLRATLMGGPARFGGAGASWEDMLTRVVVRRGAEAMPVADPLPITLPTEARRLPDGS